MTERAGEEHGLSQSQIDLRDKAQEEATGGNGPRASRFLTGENDPRRAKEREEKERRERTMRLAAQLASAEQIAACLDRLDHLQTRLDDAFAELEEWRADLEDRTVRLKDGTAIYRTENGRFAAADGAIIPADQLPGDIPADAATLAERQRFLERTKQLSGIQDGIDTDRETLNSGKATEADIERIEADMEKAEAVIAEEESVALTTENTLSADRTALSFEQFNPAP